MLEEIQNIKRYGKVFHYSSKLFSNNVSLRSEEFSNKPINTMSFIFINIFESLENFMITEWSAKF